MSSKLVRKKKNKPKYGWMQDEIDALARKDDEKPTPFYEQQSRHYN